MAGLSPRVDHWDDRRYGARSAPTLGDMQTLHLRVSIFPAAAMAVLGAAIVAFLVAGSPSATMIRVALAAAAVGAALVLLTAAYGAKAATRHLHRQLSALRTMSAHAQEDVQRLAERLRRGERPAPRPAQPISAGENDPLALLAHDLEREQHAVEKALLQVASLTAGGEAEQRVEVFVNLARRMQSLVHREIQLLDDLESQVEDPVLLKGLFTVDHLATRMRRQSESLAVLGGAASRRQWSRPVTMHEALRAAVAEVEQYSRVKVVPPVEGTLRGNAVADIIHLIAELIENATKFSAPHTRVLLRAQSVTAGLAIEVEDRGLGMLLPDQQRMNDVLADPSLININELLRDGRIGLFVVSTLARRHGIKVQLQNNIYGGVQAVVVLPKTLIDEGTRERELPQETEPQPVAAAAAHAADANRPGFPPSPSHSPATPSAAVGPDLLRTQPAGGRHAVDGSNSAAAATAAGQRESATAAHRGEQSNSAAEKNHAGATPAAHVLTRHPADPGGQQADWGGPPANSAARPPLPKRKVQTHLAPQLRDAPGSPRQEPAPDQISGLMAAFQRGISRAEEEEKNEESAGGD